MKGGRRHEQGKLQRQNNHWPGLVKQLHHNNASHDQIYRLQYLTSRIAPKYHDTTLRNRARREERGIMLEHIGYLR